MNTNKTPLLFCDDANERCYLILEDRGDECKCMEMAMFGDAILECGDTVIAKDELAMMRIDEGWEVE